MNMNIFEGVDTTSFNNIVWAFSKMAGLFLLVPCILGGVVGKLLRVKQRTMGFIVGLFGFIGLYIMLTNFDNIYSWLT